MIQANFSNGTNKVYTNSSYQYDKGQILVVSGIALPETFDVHISNTPERGIAANYKGDPEKIIIPDAYFMSGEYVYVWLYLTEQSFATENTVLNSGTTIYEIVIPVIKRPAPLQRVLGEKKVIGYTVDENHALVPVIYTETIGE